MAAKKLTTKNVTFRFNEEDFQVQLVFESEKGKLIASSSSIKFLDFLKSLNIVTLSADTDTWFNNCNNLTISCSSNNKLSYKIRKKASLCGLKVIPGESFKRKRAEDCKVAFQRHQTLIK